MGGNELMFNVIDNPFTPVSLGGATTQTVYLSFLTDVASDSGHFEGFTLQGTKTGSTLSNSTFASAGNDATVLNLFAENGSTGWQTSGAGITTTQGTAVNLNKVTLVVLALTITDYQGEAYGATDPSGETDSWSLYLNPTSETNLGAAAESGTSTTDLAFNTLRMGGGIWPRSQQ